MNESAVFFYFRYVLVNWIYKSRVVLLEQINVFWHQVFVAQNSQKSSLFLCDLVIHFIDVQFLFQYAIGLRLRGCHSNVRLGQSHSAQLITKSVYTGVSEWVTHLHIEVPKTNFVSTLRVYHSFKKGCSTIVSFWCYDRSPRPALKTLKTGIQGRCPSCI